jgi:hypothetical protein
MAQPMAPALQKGCAMRPTLSTRLACFALALCALGAGCSISPKPEPPAVKPKVEMGSVVTKPTNSFGNCVVAGDPGAVDTVGATVRIYNLDNDQPAVEGIVKQDGSFEIEVFLADGDELRLEVIAEVGRSEPIDVIATQCGAKLVLSTRALADCLVLTPAAELDLANGQSVEVANHCAANVQIEAPLARRAASGLLAGQGAVWPAVLPSGSSVQVQVSFQSVGVAEEILFIEASSPQHDRRPITVIAAGP